jgi:hypothetical protein
MSDTSYISDTSDIIDFIKTEAAIINDCPKYYIETNTTKMICLSADEKCPINYPFYNETSKQCMKSVSFESLLTLNLSCYNSSEEKEILYGLFKTTLIETYSGNDNLIMTTQDENTFQLTNTLNELNTKKGAISNDNSLSMIDLGECGELLKSRNNLSPDTPLIILKLEKAGEIASKRNIQYEVYNPNTLEIMDLSICDDEKIDIFIPVSLSGQTQELHSDLLSKGYDLFNINDSFYQDICTPYTTINGTDILLSDRILNYYNDTETSCQEGCQYSEYLSETKHLKCECSVNNKNISTQTTENKDEIFDGNLILKSFYDVLKYSNYKVLKCYQLVFNLQILKINYGSIIFICYYIIYTIFNIVFFIKGISNVRIYISKILIEEHKYNSNSNNNNNNNNKNMVGKRKTTFRKSVKMPPKRTIM